MATLQKRLIQLFVEFGDEVLDCVRDTKGVDVEDVRLAVVGRLRGAVAGYDAAEYASDTRPMPPSDPNGEAAGS